MLLNGLFLIWKVLEQLKSLKELVSDCLRLDSLLKYKVLLIIIVIIIIIIISKVVIHSVLVKLHITSLLTILH